MELGPWLLGACGLSDFLLEVFGVQVRVSALTSRHSRDSGVLSGSGVLHILSTVAILEYRARVNIDIRWSPNFSKLVSAR